jgi:hypothetical protein
MDVLAPYVCSYCDGIRGYCPECGASVHADEFLPGVGCVICSERVRHALIHAKLNGKGAQ